MSTGRSIVHSELYEEQFLSNICELANSNSLLKIEFMSPFSEGANGSLDEEGDMIVNRKMVIHLEVKFSTTIPLVGLQLWRGALLLADFLLFTGFSILNSQTVFELAAGVGLTTIVAAMFAEEVISTDIPSPEILNMIERNIKRNSHLLKSLVSVHSLNFYEQEWSETLQEKIKASQIILAADVIYDNDLTEAFVSTLTKILSLPKKKTIFIALEKRYVFTTADLETVAPCYDYFLECLKKKWTIFPMSNWNVKQLKTDFPQYFDYQRTPHLVLLEIKN